MYNDIGKKIKTLAIVCAGLEAIASVILGIGLMDGYIGELLGSIVIIGGICTAFVSSWLLYGFGELIDKMVDNENNTREIADLLRQYGVNKTNAESHRQNDYVTVYKKETTEEIKEEYESAEAYERKDGRQLNYRYKNENTIVCNACGCEQPKRKVCWKCGINFNMPEFTEKENATQESKSSTQNTEAKSSMGSQTYCCGKCGNSGPYGEYCPRCGSTIKIYELFK